MSAYEIFADWYDLLTEDVDYAAESRYICGILSRYGIRDGILLDLACGTGSLSLQLAEAGYDVIGVDGSADMLCIARQKAAGADAQILFLCQQMQQLDLYGTVKSAVCMLDSLNHLTSLSDVREAIRRVSLFLEPGGVFVFDVNTPYKHREVLGDNVFVRQADGLFLVWQNAFSEPDTVRITLDFFEEDGDAYVRSTEQFSERAYTLDTLKQILNDHHLTVDAIYDDWSGEPPAQDAQRWTIVARKQEDLQNGQE